MVTTLQHYITPNNLHIEDSYKVSSKEEMEAWLKLFHKECPDTNVWKRSYGSLEREWITHNVFYYLHLFRSHTKDVDLNYPQSCFEKIAYTIIGGIAGIFF